MLTPDYLKNLPNSVIDLYRKTETKIINDVARQISKEGYLTPTGLWQVDRLKELGIVRDNIIKELSRATGKIKSVITGLFKKSMDKNTDSDDEIYLSMEDKTPPYLEDDSIKQVISAGLLKTNKLFVNLTNNSALYTSNELANVLDRAYNMTLHGFSSDVAIKSAIKEFSAQGITSMKYPSGHRDHIDVVVRRNIMTGINQTANKVSDMRQAEFGWDLCEVSAHSGAREGDGISNHAGWQGEIYSVSGDSEKYPALSVTGYGSGDGLGGWNCRHSKSPYKDGMARTYTKEQLESYKDKKYKYKEKDYAEHEIEQIMRHNERQIRKWKRESEALASADIDNSQELVKLSKWKAKQHDIEKQLNDYNSKNKSHKQKDYAEHEIEQIMRRNERQIRKWKRESEALELVGLDSSLERLQLKEWQAKQRDITEQTGIHRDYTRERAGKQYGVISLAGNPFVEEKKITEYLFSKTHPIGKNKAIVFDNILGYNIDNKDVFIKELKETVKNTNVKKVEKTVYGSKITSETTLYGVKNRNMKVVSVWEIATGETNPRLITAYPK